MLCGILEMLAENILTSKIFIFNSTDLNNLKMKFIKKIRSFDLSLQILLEMNTQKH